MSMRAPSSLTIYLSTQPVVFQPGMLSRPKAGSLPPTTYLRLRQRGANDYGRLTASTAEIRCGSCKVTGVRPLLLTFIRCLPRQAAPS